MRVAVVGASGVLGRALCPTLAARGHAVRALVRDVSRVTGDARACDLLTVDVNSLAALLDGCDTVVHAATAIPANPGAPGAWDRNTAVRTRGTAVLLAAAEAAGVGAYVQQSIVMAYRDGGDEWLDESALFDESPTRAVVCAPVISMEAQVRVRDPLRLRWTILRAGLFVGSGTGQEALVERLRAGTEVVAGDGGQFVSLVDVEDAADAFVLAVEKAPAGSTYNVCDAPRPYGEYVDALAARVGGPRPARDAARMRPPSFRCATGAARRDLGWRPRRGLFQSF